VEFEPAFRWIDVADEVAFLLMDLESLQRRVHAHAFLSGYLAQSGDFAACRLLEIYKAHRALVRAKVIALSSMELSEPLQIASARNQYAAYLACASNSLQNNRPSLILMSGVSGSGKTWLATRLAPILRAVHLRSDVERKRLAGRGELERSTSGIQQGLYSHEATEAVYGHLLVCARYVLEGGYTALVDATFPTREQRASFRAMASQLEVPVCIVHCRAERSVLEARVVERYERGDDASEADLSVLDWQQALFEPIGADEQIPVVEADTSDTDVVAESVRKIGVLTGALQHQSADA
jgi:uncharacterized protein